LKIISHRANLNGIDPKRENNPVYIDECIEEGFDVEIDLRVKNGNFYLGHDYPVYKISEKWLIQRSDFLLVHIKEIEALNLVFEKKLNIHHFCHQDDEFTFTSNNLIWCHNLNLLMNDKCLIPLLSLEQVNSFNKTDIHAICTDYVYEALNIFVN